MEILARLPNEMKWNVLKFLRHPIAVIMKELIDSFEESVSEYRKYKEALGMSYGSDEITLIEHVNLNRLANRILKSII